MLTERQQVRQQLWILTDRMWALSQWWVSISLAILVVAHLAAHRINLLILLSILFMYWSYTAMFVVTYSTNLTYLLAFGRDLNEFASNSAGVREVLTNEASILGSFLLLVSALSLFVAVNVYLVKTFKEERGT